MTTIDDIKKRPTFTLLRSSDSSINATFNNITHKLVKNVEEPLPINFKGQEVWKDYISPIRDQGKCGSCWAFATTSVLADKMGIQSRGKLKPILSPAKLVLCDLHGAEKKIFDASQQQEFIADQSSKVAKEFSCSGNTLLDSWRYLYLYGTTLESCFPYTLRKGIDRPLGEYDKNSDLPLCNSISGPLNDICSDYVYNPKNGKVVGTPARAYRCIRYYVVPGVEKDGGNEERIRREIYKWGPVTTGMLVYPNFYTFDAKTEIYDWDGVGPQTGGHAVEIIGWGEENDVKYWWIKNSWSRLWGEEGYFKMKRGINLCQLEENVMSAIPDFFFPEEIEIKSDGTQQGNMGTWAEPEEEKKLREIIDSGKDAIAGGIDPYTGYTRRIIDTMPGIDLTPLITKNDLNLKNFWAGKLPPLPPPPSSKNIAHIITNMILAYLLWKI